ncbi:Hypothetical protein A7982_09871 [Minicystis rosea]|nr:Hypothetical protein A7982_09871 [Minicystis rosea]
MNTEEPIRCEAGTRLAAWLAAVDAVTPNQWASLPDLGELPPHVLADSVYWCDHVLLPDVNPHDVAGAVHAVRCGDGASLDLIRHVYTAKGLDLDLVEGRNFVLVRVGRRSLDLLALPEDERADAVARVTEAIFREPLSFNHCEPLANQASFCSNKEIDPRVLASWTQRAEGGVRSGELWFIAYKRVSQIVGFANATQWFSDESCLKVGGKRRGQRCRIKR